MSGQHRAGGPWARAGKELVYQHKFIFKLAALAAIAIGEDGFSKEREEGPGGDDMEVFPPRDGEQRIQSLKNYVRRKVKSSAKNITKAIATGKASDLKPRKLLSEDKVKVMSQLNQKI